MKTLEQSETPEQCHLKIQIAGGCKKRSPVITFTSYRWFWNFEGWAFSNIAFVYPIEKSIKAQYSLSPFLDCSLWTTLSQPLGVMNTVLGTLQILASFQTQAHTWPFLLLPPRFVSFSYSHVTLAHLLRDTFLQHIWVQPETLLLSPGPWPAMGMRVLMPETGMLACMFP